MTIKQVNISFFVCGQGMTSGDDLYRTRSVTNPTVHERESLKMRNMNSAMLLATRFCPPSHRRCRVQCLLSSTTTSLSSSSSSSSSCNTDMMGTSAFFIAASKNYRKRPFSSNNNNSEAKPRDDDPRRLLKQDFAYCRKIVQERDREGFLCGLLLPSEAQNSYFAIRAFNVELASVKDGASNRMRQQSGLEVGGMTTTIALQMRMQWWREALHEIYSIDDSDDSSDAAYLQPPPKVGGHLMDNNIAAASLLKSAASASSSISCWNSPIVRALCEANREKQLTRRFLERLIDAREMDINVKQLATLKDASMYAEETVSSLLYLTLECTNVREDAADEVASHAGVGIGLVTALRSTPVRWLHHGEIPIPADLWKPSSSSSHSSPLHAHQETFRKSEHDAKQQQQKQQDASNQQLSALNVGLAKSPAEEADFVQAVQQLAQRASTHLAEARKLQGHIPKQGRAGLLPVIPALHYLSLLETSKYNLFDPQLINDRNQFRLLLLLGRTWLTGIF